LEAGREGLRGEVAHPGGAVMTATTAVPPREMFAAEARRITEMHTDWDSPHQFITLHWDGERVSYGTVAMITTDVHPTMYPGVMAGIAREALTGEDRANLYAYALQIEGYAVVEPGSDATEEERRRFLADRVGRRFSERQDAVEIATTSCVDVHGRIWTATKRRDKPEIDEKFWAPDATDAPRGHLAEGLLNVARITGAVLYGLPSGVRL
jgi:hypothetical protein